MFHKDGGCVQDSSSILKDLKQIITTLTICQTIMTIFPKLRLSFHSPLIHYATAQNISSPVDLYDHTLENVFLLPVPPPGNPSKCN